MSKTSVKLFYAILSIFIFSALVLSVIFVQQSQDLASKAAFVKTNLVLNNSFEDWVDSVPSLWSGSPNGVNKSSHAIAGTKAAMVLSGSLSQSVIGLKSFTSYRLVFWTKGGQGKASVTYSYFDKDNNNQLRKSTIEKKFGPNNEYKEIKFRLKTKKDLKDGTLKINFLPLSQTPVVIDEVTLEVDDEVNLPTDTPTPSITTPEAANCSDINDQTVCTQNNCVWASCATRCVSQGIDLRKVCDMNIVCSKITQQNLCSRYFPKCLWADSGDGKGVRCRENTAVN